MLDRGRTSWNANDETARPSPSDAVRFLTVLDPGGKFTFQTFDDDALRKDESLTHIIHGTLAGDGVEVPKEVKDCWPELVQLNSRGAGIFVTVNKTDLKGRTKDNVTKVRALFVDLDGAPLDPVTTCSTPPHIIVESSPGRWHAYWLVADVPLDQFKPMQKALAARFNGDVSVNDLPRVLRLPGFIHRKREPFLSLLQDVDPRPTYTFAQMRAAFPPAQEPRPEPSAGKEPQSDGITDRCRGQAWAQAALTASAAELANAGEGSRHKTLLAKAVRMATMITRGWIDRHEVRRALLAAAESNGQIKQYGIAHFDDTFKDGVAYGILEPHPDLPDNDPEPATATPPPVDETQEAKPQPAAPIAACTIDETLAVFERWLLLRDLNPVLAVLGTIAANLLPGDPVWLGLIAPPSSAKTEILNSISALPYVVQAATLTPAGLLSGTPKKQQHATARGGLLRQIGAFGILMMKDFGSVLSMRPDAKAETLAALREVYDGAWTRHLGTEGGKTLAWKGKVGLVFGATGVIDSHYSVIGAMGDRFLLHRLTPDPGQLRRAFEHVGAATGQMRKELAEAVARLFAGPFPEPRPLAEAEFDRIERVVALAVRLRGAVDRDRHTREVEYIFGAEGPARLGLTLERLLAGLDTLGVERDTAMDVVEAVAMDSVPPLRRRAYEFLLGRQDVVGHPEFVPTSAVAEALGLPTITTRRALEDLAAYALVLRVGGGKGKPDQWAIA